MRSLGFDSRQLCISFARAKQCSTTVDYSYSDFLQEHEEGSSAAVMARWYDDVVEAKPPVVVITVGGHATVARWGERETPYPSIVWVPEPHSVVFEDCVDAESRGHTWARNDDGYLKCRLKTSCHAVVHIGGELVVRSLWEDELPRYIELVTEGVDSADEEGSDGKFAHNEVLSYGHGEQLIGSEHPLGNDNACLNCAVRLRPKPVEPPAEEGVQRKLSLHLANVSFGLGSDDTETVC